MANKEEPRVLDNDRWNSTRGWDQSRNATVAMAVLPPPAAAALATAEFCLHAAVARQYIATRHGLFAVVLFQKYLLQDSKNWHTN